MPVPFDLPDVISIYRPAGAGAPLYSDVPARVVPNLKVGRGSTSGPTYLTWTHWVDLQPTQDIKDGCTRAAGANYVTYNDGDGVRATLAGRSYRFIVVWTEDRFTNTPTAYKRVYLIRDSVTGP